MSPKKASDESQPEVIDIPNGGSAPSQLARYEPSDNDVAITAVFNVATANKRLDELKAFVRDYLVPEEDYGIIPGTGKPTLFKSGADKLCDIYGMADEYTCTNRVEDWDRGLFDYEFKCTLTSRRTGRLIGTGVGSCSSFETKYRYRDQKRVCPSCGKETIIKGRKEFGGGWICWKKEGKSDGCGAKFAEADTKITEQSVGRAQNEDPADQKNTILKMAKKRAKVDAVISATRSSGLFTQDMEDRPRDDSAEGDKQPVSTGTAKPAAAQATARPAQQATAKPAAQQAKPAAAAKPAQAASAAQTARPAQAAPTAATPAEDPKPAAKKPKSRSDRAREIAKVANCNSTLIIQFICAHLGCDNENINQVPAARIDATISALETCLKRFPASAVGNLIRNDDHAMPEVKQHFLETFANLTKE
jgi:hypothetical protein